MKKLLLLLLLFAGGYAGAQTTNLHLDSRLNAKFTPEQIQRLSTDAPNVLKYWNYYVQNAYSIMQMPASKSIANYPRLKVKDPSHFNIFTSGLSASDKVQIFRLSGGKALIIKKRQTIVNGFNKQHKSNPLR